MKEVGSLQNSPLLLALQYKRLDIANLLIKSGANVNEHEKSARKMAPLNYAAYHGFNKLAELLVKKGANVNKPPEI